MGEILAHTSAFFENLFGGGADGGNAGVESKIVMDAGRKFKEGLSHGTSGGKRLQRVRSELRMDADARRLELILIGSEAFGTMIVVALW